MHPLRVAASRWDVKKDWQTRGGIRRGKSEFRQNCVGNSISAAFIQTMPVDDPSDGRESTASLLRRYVKSGSHAAFGDLVRRYGPMVFGAALRRTGQHTTAEDVTQIVFRDLALRAPALAEDNRLGAWLHRRAWMVASDLLRAERRRMGRERTAAAQLAAGEDPTPWAEMAPILDESLGRLPRADRDALVLRFFEGRSLRDVGAILGLSADTTQKRISRALDRLRESFLRRGIKLSAALLNGVLLENARAVSAPAGLLDRTSSHALRQVSTVPAACWKVLPRIAPIAAGVAAVCLASAQPLFSSRRERPAPLAAVTQAAPNTATAKPIPAFAQGLSLEQKVRRLADLLLADPEDYPTRYLYFQELALASSVPEHQRIAALDLLVAMLQERKYDLSGNRGHVMYHTWIPSIAQSDPAALLDRIGRSAPMWLQKMGETALYIGLREQPAEIKDPLCRRILDDGTSAEYVRHAAVTLFGRDSSGKMDEARRPELLKECMDRLRRGVGRGWGEVAGAFVQTDDEHLELLAVAEASTALSVKELASLHEAAIKSWSRSSIGGLADWSQTQPPAVRAEAIAAIWSRAPLGDGPADQRMAPADWVYSITENPSTLIQSVGSAVLSDPDTWLPWLEQRPAIFRGNTSHLEHLLHQQLTGFHIHPTKKEEYLKTPATERLRRLFLAWRQADPQAAAACLADTSVGTYQEMRQVLRSIP